MRLNVAYSSDDNYAKFLGVSLLSLLECNYSDFEKICVYILDNGICEDNKTKIIELAKPYHGEIHFISFKELCHDLKTDNCFPVSSFGRIFLSRLKDVDKIIYLDCDSIITSSFKELWNTDISDYYIAGVQDNVYPFFKEWIGLSKEERYINAGFLLMNLENWRKEKVEEKMLQFIESYHGTVPHHDQGTMNAICRGHILILHPRYNLQPPMLQFSSKQIKKISEDSIYYTEQELKEAIENPCFIHYTLDIYNRPWFEPCSHPLKEKYRSVMERSPWGNFIEYKALPKKVKITKMIQLYFPYSIYLIFVEIVKRKKYRRLSDKYKR